jgi:Trpc4-associated protein
MSIVTVDEINHENICCLNTAIVMLVFQYRKRQLPDVLAALRHQEMNASSTLLSCETMWQASRKKNDLAETEAPHATENILQDGTFKRDDAPAGFLCSNFRSLLWFWIQYYIPRGRDRLSLEQSSDMTFREWYHVVALLCADDGSPTALLARPKTLPASPYTVHHMTSPMMMLARAPSSSLLRMQ